MKNLKKYSNFMNYKFKWEKLKIMECQVGLI